jgi:hypothetical protein
MRSVEEDGDVDKPIVALLLELLQNDIEPDERIIVNFHQILKLVIFVRPPKRSKHLRGQQLVRINDVFQQGEVLVCLTFLLQGSKSFRRSFFCANNEENATVLFSEVTLEEVNMSLRG